MKLIGAGIFALLISGTPCIAGDADEANRLFVTASQKTISAMRSDDPLVKYDAYREAKYLIDDLLEKYPATNAAVLVVSGQNIGAITYLEIQAAVQKLQESPEICARDVSLECVAGYIVQEIDTLSGAKRQAFLPISRLVLSLTDTPIDRIHFDDPDAKIDPETGRRAYVEVPYAAHLAWKILVYREIKRLGADYLENGNPYSLRPNITPAFEFFNALGFYLEDLVSPYSPTIPEVLSVLRSHKTELAQLISDQMIDPNPLFDFFSKNEPAFDPELRSWVLSIFLPMEYSTGIEKFLTDDEIYRLEDTSKIVGILTSYHMDKNDKFSKDRALGFLVEYVSQEADLTIEKRNEILRRIYSLVEPDIKSRSIDDACALSSVLDAYFDANISGNRISLAEDILYAKMRVSLHEFTQEQREQLAGCIYDLYSTNSSLFASIIREGVTPKIWEKVYESVLEGKVNPVTIAALSYGNITTREAFDVWLTSLELKALETSNDMMEYLPRGMIRGLRYAQQGPNPLSDDDLRYIVERYRNGPLFLPEGNFPISILDKPSLSDLYSAFAEGFRDFNGAISETIRYDIFYYEMSKLLDNGKFEALLQRFSQFRTEKTEYGDISAAYKSGNALEVVLRRNEDSVHFDGFVSFLFDQAPELLAKAFAINRFHEKLIGKELSEDIYDWIATNENDEFMWEEPDGYAKFYATAQHYSSLVDAGNIPALNSEFFSSEPFSHKWALAAVYLALALEK